MNFKNTVIFGDSYSTFKGFVPEGYAIYYSEAEKKETDVRSVNETWWYQLIEETNSNLVLNNSWSGSTIGYTGYNNTDCSHTSSFIHRLNQLVENNFFEENKIDTAFVFGGTNDSWCGAPVGELKFSDWEKEDLFSVLPAVCCFLSKLKSAMPNGKIYCLVNTELNPQIAEGMIAACREYGIKSIVFKKIDKNYGHPTIKGMKDIKEQVLKAVEE